MVVRHSDDRLLDAAKACILDGGIHTTTLADVARRAGVSRMTLYRRYIDVRTLVHEVLLRDFTALLRRQAGLELPGNPAREVLVTQTVAVVEAFQGDPLLRQVLDTDPEFITPYAMRRFGGIQEAAVAILATRLEAGHRDGSIRKDSVAVQANTVLLTAQAFVLSASAVAAVPSDRLLGELARLLDSYLKP